MQSWHFVAVADPAIRAGIWLAAETASAGCEGQAYRVVHASLASMTPARLAESLVSNREASH